MNTYLAKYKETKPGHDSQDVQLKLLYNSKDIADTMNKYPDAELLKVEELPLEDKIALVKEAHRQNENAQIALEIAQVNQEIEILQMRKAQLIKKYK